MEAIAISKFNRISTKKLRRVALAIDKMKYQQAMAVLTTLPQKGAKILSKTVKSAGSNLLNKETSAHEDQWFIKEIQVNRGPYIKRTRPRARGRADRICKPTTHLRVVVSDDQE